MKLCCTTFPNWAIVISLLSLLLSLFTLFVNFFLRPIFRYTVHDKIRGCSAGGKIVLLIGFTIDNQGARTGVVKKVTVELGKKEKDSPLHLLQWEYFFADKRVNADGEAHLAMHTTFDRWAEPIIVSGRSATSINIRFISKEAVLIPAGNYTCRIKITPLKKREKEFSITKELVISPENAQVLNANPGTVVDFSWFV
ncbi:hypothetical protein J2T02_003614 [Chitinophaga terrae (ex Kim and Jung 2007)]|uniref:hypothetical protein n=1 Tax=Chitinophaga terrae (ex Kim and Jung 2007) TaxID=408074 RepID=UPI00278A3D4B|nr:hypothetical protein [Chitinophaga terrae (ex Kim and Jung 2007)]MDQ0108481.1 hypothetical protein [Chitinophaga terrae (ex Kim and Jung 2007)]